MNTAKFFDKFDLHYSLIENIGYFPSRDKLIITLNFCNWTQEEFQPGEPENIIGNLIFSGVKELTIEPDTYIPDGNEILTIKLERTIHNLDKIQFVLFASPDEDVAIVSFMAKNITWEPLWEIESSIGN